MSIFSKIKVDSNYHQAEIAIEDIVIYNKKTVIKTEDKQKVQTAFDFLAEYQKGKVIYGINTGFGPMAQYRIADKDLNQLQYNIIRSHSCGAGHPLPQECVRAAILVRLQTFLAGKSAVHPDTIQILTDFLNHNITPVVPEHGSVGASGDLVQLSHIALALIGEGEVFYDGAIVETAKAMKACGITPLKMHIREGLALTNGTAVMTGIGLVNLIQSRKLLKWSVLASVMMNEIASSYDDFMSEVLNDLKLHDGQRIIAGQMREISSSSKLLRKREQVLYNSKENQEKIFTHKVQPYYSLRCTPQVLGPIAETIDNAGKILIEEFYSVDDNPIVDPQTECVYHGGNFHGDYISFEMDKLKIAITKLTMLAERQLNYLFHDRINGILPPFLNMGELGLNYGLQAAQFTATSTTAECQMLSNPMYVHSIPNNNDNQDIVSMGTNSASIAQMVIENSFQVMAIQMIALVQAVDCLGVSEQLSDNTKSLYADIRNIVPKFISDTTKYVEINNVIEYLKNYK
ncbi:MAG: aromatic amino acid ammonia-lyase [Mucinivorans sp.]